jgi:hypothetical protein
MDSLVTYRNTKIPCLISLSTATSSILFDGEAQGQRTGAGVEAAHENGRTCTSIDTYYSGESLIYSTA